MKGKEQRWDTFVSYSNLKSPPSTGGIRRNATLK